MHRRGTRSLRGDPPPAAVRLQDRIATRRRRERMRGCLPERLPETSAPASRSAWFPCLPDAFASCLLHAFSVCLRPAFRPASRPACRIPSPCSSRTLSLSACRTDYSPSPRHACIPLFLHACRTIPLPLSHPAHGLLAPDCLPDASALFLPDAFSVFLCLAVAEAFTCACRFCQSRRRRAQKGKKSDPMPFAGRRTRGA